MKSASAWALGQLGRHTPDHAKAVADTGVLPLLVTIENDTHSTEDLKGKCRKALKAIVAKLTFMPALDALVHRSASTLVSVVDFCADVDAFEAKAYSWCYNTVCVTRVLWLLSFGARLVCQTLH
jgi:hypothetical protein